MLQVNYIRQNAVLVKERLAIKNFADLALVDRIVEQDEEVRKLKTTTESLQSAVNAASKEIGMLMGKGEKEAAENKKQEVAGHKLTLQNLQQQLTAAEQLLHDELVVLPNLPHQSVPKGKTPEDNEVVREGGIKPTLPATAVPHWDLIKQYNLVDFETGVKLTGSGFPLYKNKGAKLQRALIQYFLDYNIEAGYTEYLPPLMVNEASAYGTGQLPDKEGQMYHITADGFYPRASMPRRRGAISSWTLASALRTPFPA